MIARAAPCARAGARLRVRIGRQGPGRASANRATARGAGTVEDRLPSTQHAVHDTPGPALLAHCSRSDDAAWAWEKMDGLKMDGRNWRVGGPVLVEWLLHGAPCRVPASIGCGPGVV